MKSLFITSTTTIIPSSSWKTRDPPIHVPVSSLPISHFKNRTSRLPTITRSQVSSIQTGNEEEPHPEAMVEELSVPEHWLLPSKAFEESEWLRVTLHKWLDDEYCPEPTNVEISKVAARSYYESLLEKQRDLGEILLKMARELESISYQDSFHGAFSSANAAVNLIVQRVEQS
ncbi:hypothetical protein LWI28_005716 [Acer negundo]|uniref:Uncharacterized protein n=1 Tax=Acer negundo TaxID=4023 RepID=A0AAD5IYP8_ACENE|nr:hypothetical protein LWI28_005716 [Acer negundo]KAK4841404.1 hypothetical protein QYF36_003861 [Acer negundo]